MDNWMCNNAANVTEKAWQKASYASPSCTLFIKPHSVQLLMIKDLEREDEGWSLSERGTNFGGHNQEPE
jgi:hypothetical protein